MPDTEHVQEIDITPAPFDVLDPRPWNVWGIDTLEAGTAVDARGVIVWHIVASSFDARVARVMCRKWNHAGAPIGEEFRALPAGMLPRW